MPSYRPTKCRKCGKRLVVRNGKYGKFLGCTGYPKCRYTFDLPKEKSRNKISCPKCGVIVFKKRRKDGEYLICKRYPKCSFKKPLKEGIKIKIKCPKCRKKMNLIKEPSGWILKCDNSPKCNYIFNLNTGKASKSLRIKEKHELEPMLNEQSILQAISFDWRDINYLIEKLRISDQIDIMHLKNKLKEFERKKYITKISVEGLEYWKKG